MARTYIREYKVSKINNEYVEDLNGSMIALEYHSINNDSIKRDIAISKFDDMENRIFKVTFVEQILDEGFWKTLNTYFASVTDQTYVDISTGLPVIDTFNYEDDLYSPIRDENNNIIGYNQKQVVKENLITEASYFIAAFSPYFFPLFTRVIKNKKSITE